MNPHEGIASLTFVGNKSGEVSLTIKSIVHRESSKDLG